MFALIYNRENVVKRFQGNHLPKGIIKSYNVIINIKHFYDQPIDSGIKLYKEIRKLTTG